MALTLIEQSKLKDNPLQKGVVMCFPEVSPVLEGIEFLNVSSDTYKYNRADMLPRSDFRAINESYTEESATLDAVTESLTISGGFSDVDRALIKTQGNINDIRAIHDMLKAKSCAMKWQKTFFKGDVESNPKEFDGLQARLIGDQLIQAGSSDGGDALSLIKLDELIDQVDGFPDVLYMNKTMRRRLSAAARLNTVGGNVNYTVDEFGRSVMQYNDVPIRVIEEDEEGNAILGFNELASTGSTATATSIYAVRFSPIHVFGLQCGDMDVLDLGLYSGGVVFRTLIEWISGFSIAHNKGAARLKGISDAAITA